MVRQIRRMLAAFGVFAVLVTQWVVPPADAAPAGEKPSVDAIRQLLQATDAAGRYKKTMPQINKQIWDALLPQVTGIPDDLHREISEEMTRQMMAMVPQLLELLIPIYRRHLTAAEVEAAIAFYSSSSGKSIISKMALITVESFSVGMKFGQAMGERATQTAIQRLREKGYQL